MGNLFVKDIIDWLLILSCQNTMLDNVLRIMPKKKLWGKTEIVLFKHYYTRQILPLNQELLLNYTVKIIVVAYGGLKGASLNRVFMNLYKNTKEYNPDLYDTIFTKMKR